jgi:hypothetical protein
LGTFLRCLYDAMGGGLLCPSRKTGLYFTLDAKYALNEYGFNENVHGLDVVPLLVCVVLVGNALPVIERPFLAGSDADIDLDSFYSKPLAPKADSHLVRHPHPQLCSSPQVITRTCVDAALPIAFPNRSDAPS